MVYGTHFIVFSLIIFIYLLAVLGLCCCSVFSLAAENRSYTIVVEHVLQRTFQAC